MKFEQAYKDLNDEQKDVVKHPGGPLLVVAGAGTGKTRVIIEKINKLLNDGVDPSSILAVTFTEKAASEMLDRILKTTDKLLPELLVMTFNGFGNMVLNEYGVNIGMGRNIRLLSSQAQIVFFRERIDEFELDYFLPLTSSPDGVIENILGLFSQLKQHVITPEEYQDFARKMPEGDEVEQLEKKKHQELAKAYQTYTELCRKENVIDYDDQIYLSIQLLRQRPNVQRELQNRFKTLFIDEFQDTNPMQSQFIDLLVNNDKNIIVVGDDDQSIYGFRGATLQNILTFKDRYPESKEIALIKNYRSYQKILDISYDLIQKNNPDRLETSLGINKRLESDKPGNEPMLKRFEDRRQEMYWLAKDIAARIKAGESPGSIAVLVRSNQTGSKVHDALALADVEHQVIGSSSDLYATPIVRTLIELARTIAEPANNASLHHTLTSEIFGISNQIIAPLATQARYEHTTLRDLLVEQKVPEIKKALEFVKSWRENAANSSVRILIWNAINDSGYFDRLKATAMKNEEAANSIHNLSQFFDTLREFESVAIQPSVSQYLVSLPALMAAGENTDDNTLDISDNEVTVITVHKAKGLEWDSVYVPGLTEQSFPLKRQGGGLQIPEALRTASESPADEHYAEERRLMYVAATRARKNLTLLYADKTESGTNKKPSRFINEMFGDETAETTSVEDITKDQTTTLGIPIDAIPKLDTPKSIYDGTKVYLSVSQAVVLLDCPLNFYYKFVLKAPEKPTPSTTYGSYMHGFFEQINKERRDDKLRPLPEYIEELESGWQRAGYVSKRTQERAYKQAHDTLSNFYQQAVHNSPPTKIEDKFEVELDPEAIVLRGKVDAVFEHSGAEIVDYKTGNKVKDEKTAKSNATTSQQLTMYALAWQIQNGEIPSKLSLQYVDTGYAGSVKKTQRGIDGLRVRLGKAVEGLKDGKFTPSGQHKYCIHPPLGN